MSVYILTALPALSLVLPLAPFAYKLRPYRPLTMLICLIFILTTLYALLAFPFSIESPLKIYFQQRVQFPSVPVHSAMTHAPGSPKVITSLVGPERYIRSLVPYLPSSQANENDVSCKNDEAKAGLVTCEWESGSRMMPVPGTFDGDDDDVNWNEGQFLKVGVERVGASSARIGVKGRNTRSCRVYFDSAPVYQYVVRPPGRNARQGAAGDGDLTNEYGAGVGESSDMQEGYEVGPTGVKEVRLWSRTWGRAFVVDVDWGQYTPSEGSSTNRSASDESALQGRIACEWAEYESAMVDHGMALGVNGTQADYGEGAYMGVSLADDVDGLRPKIPALEEVLAFLPDWAVVSKYADGLVEAWAPFSL